MAQSLYPVLLNITKNYQLEREEDWRQIRNGRILGLQAKESSGEHCKRASAGPEKKGHSLRMEHRCLT